MMSWHQLNLFRFNVLPTFRLIILTHFSPLGTEPWDRIFRGVDLKLLLITVFLTVMNVVKSLHYTNISGLIIPYWTVYIKVNL